MIPFSPTLPEPEQSAAHSLFLTAFPGLNRLQRRLPISPHGDETGGRDPEEQRSRCTPALRTASRSIYGSAAGAPWSNSPSLIHRGATQVCTCASYRAGKNVLPRSTAHRPPPAKSEERAPFHAAELFHEPGRTLRGAGPMLTPAKG